MIKLTDTLYLDADQHQYIVFNPRHRTVNGGTRIEYENPQYFTTITTALSTAISRAMRLEVKAGTITTLQDFITRQQEMIAEFTALIEPLHGRDTVVQGGGGQENEF